MKKYIYIEKNYPPPLSQYIPHFTQPYLLYFGEGNGNPLQYSCLENPMDGGAWWATVHRVAKSWTQLHFHFHFIVCVSCGCVLPVFYSKISK